MLNGVDAEDEREHDPSTSNKDLRHDSTEDCDSIVSLNIDNPTVKDLIDKSRYSRKISSDVDDVLKEESGDLHLLNLKERQKTFDKISRNMERNTAKWKRLHEFVNLVEVSDDSYSRLIDGRIEEIKSMCCSFIRPEYILDSLNTEVREFALSLVPLSRRSFENRYRKNWTKLDLFRFGGRIAHIFCLLGETHRKYPWWEKSKNSSRRNVKEIKYSINHELRMSLTTHPKYRSKLSIQQVLWFNKAVGAFGDLFSTEMEKELAKYISYEIYDEDRLIRCQGAVPNKLYYILSGKIEMVKVYRLSQGEVHKSMGFLTHKQMSEFEDFDLGKVSPTYLVARGQVEVLSLHKEDYLKLSNQTNLATVQEFLLQLSIFKDLPITSQAFQSQQIKIQYYKDEKVISSDSFKEAYFYVVKSGKVSVARQQNILFENKSTLFASTDPMSLGCKRDGKHASAMLGLPKRQKNFKQMHSENSKSTSNPKLTNSKIKLVKPHTIIGKYVASDNNRPISNDQIKRSRTVFDMKKPSDFIEKDDYKTTTDILPRVHSTKKQERETYVKLDTLNPKDIFGLESLENFTEVSQSKLVLISEGAEVLMINKRYFLESVNNNTLLEIRKLIKTYISEEEAKVIIDEDKKWIAYKRILMQRMISLHC